MGNFLKCGSAASMQRSAMIVAIIDVIYTSIVLILFVLGSGLMVKFEILGKGRNATEQLDDLTDSIFGTEDGRYDPIREKKDVAQDMGIFIIILFLVCVDFVISCIFLDGVKSRNVHECQTWLNMRWIIIVVFNIIVVINIAYGTSWKRATPDILLFIYRISGLYIGYAFYKELRDSSGINSPVEKDNPEFSEEEESKPKFSISSQEYSSNSLCTISEVPSRSPSLITTKSLTVPDSRH